MYALRWTLNVIRSVLILRVRYDFWRLEKYKKLVPVPQLLRSYMVQKLTEYSPPRRIFDRLEVV